MKHLFIINPHAGKRDRSREVLGLVEAAMAGRGLDWEAVVTQSPGHGDALVRGHAEAGAPLRVYACGGDGTLNECAAAVAGLPNAAVTHYPTGSGNDFVRMFGPGAARFCDLPALLDTSQAALDLIDCNGRLALNICSVGFDARIGYGAAGIKRLPLITGSMSYQISAVRTILQGIHRPYRVELDGEELPYRDYTLMCACNGRYYGGGFNPTAEALPDDGLLDFIIIKGVSRLTVAALIGKYARAGSRDMPDKAIVRRGRELKIVCTQPEPVNLDGERIDADKLSIRLSAKKVNFFFPSGTHYDPARRGQCVEIERETEKKRASSTADELY